MQAVAKNDQFRYTVPVERGCVMKRILLMTTGGTIASRQTAEGLAPGIGGEDLTHYLGG